MSQKKRLKGLPHDLVKSYFATDKYCVCGYMADWLLNTAQQLNIDEVTIDIINETYIPNELNFHPFTYELPFLKAIIERTLTHNGFGKDFIIEAKMLVGFRMESRELVCNSWVMDRENNKYITEPFTIISYEKFNPFEM